MQLERVFSNPINITYFLTFLVLSGTTIITLLLVTSGELTSDKSKGYYYMKNALISETSVNIIASVTYYYLLQLLQKNYKVITPVRYIDWALTTPLLLLSFVLYTTYKHNLKNSDANDKELNMLPLLVIIIANMFMLLFGYLGETGRMSRNKGLVYGFIFFFIMFGLIYFYYVKDHDSSLVLFIIFAFVWMCYGLAYRLSAERKNIAYNILDMISKGGFGIVLWISLIQDR